MILFVVEHKRKIDEIFAEPLAKLSHEILMCYAAILINVKSGFDPASSKGRR